MSKLWMVSLVAVLGGCVLNGTTVKQMRPTAIAFGDSVSNGYIIEARHDLCESVDLRHDDYAENGADLCGAAYTTYAVGKAYGAERNNGCAATELEGMRDEFQGGQHHNVLLFNSGLHDFQLTISTNGCGLSTPAAYHAAIEALADEAQMHADIVIWVDMTPVPNGTSDEPEGVETVANPIGEAIAREHGFYILNVESRYQLPHNIHYQRRGYQFLGQQVADCILTALAGQETARCHK